MIDFTKIAIEKDPAILDGNIDMAIFTFEFKKESREVKSLYCSYAHEYSLQCAAKDIGMYRKKAPQIIKIKIKYLQNYGTANERNEARD